jgi:DNA-binding Lrp family transcriptional regulator
VILPSGPVDEIDAGLLRALETDGRATVMKLAEQLGIGRSTVHSRLTELRERDVFRVIGLVDPAHLGRPVVVVFIIRVGGDPSHVLADIWALPEIAWAASMTDTTTVMAQGAFESLSVASEFTDRCLRGHGDVWNVEPHVLTAVFNPTRTREAGADHPWYTAATPKPLDDLDLAIVRALQDDGRIAYSRLADRTGLSIAASRQRAVKLMSSGVVQVRTIVDPAALGLAGVGVVCIRVRGDASAVTRNLTQFEDLHYVDQTLGTFPVLAEFHCRTLADLAERRRRVDALPTVSSTELLQMQESPAYGGSWV